MAPRLDPGGEASRPRLETGREPTLAGSRSRRRPVSRVDLPIAQQTAAEQLEYRLGRVVLDHRARQAQRRLRRRIAGRLERRRGVEWIPCSPRALSRCAAYGSSVRATSATLSSGTPSSRSRATTRSAASRSSASSPCAWKNSIGRGSAGAASSS